MSTILLEFHLPGIIIAFVFGYQIAIYFLYSYYKVKEEKLGLNKILLAFGLLYGFGLTGVFIRVINWYYFEYLTLYDIIIKFTHIFIVIGCLSFQLFVATKPFNDIINTTVTKIMIVLTIILSALILIIQDVRLNGLLILVAIFFGILYLLIFHIRIIKRSSGSIKKRLIFITIGELLMLSAILFGAKESAIFIPYQYQEIYLISLIPVLISGLAIIFFGVYRFPAFLEFDWKKYLHRLYIINQQDFSLLYLFDFSKFLLDNNITKRQSLEYEAKEKILSKGIIGINQIVSIITDTQDKKINKIEQGDFLILIEYSDEYMTPIVFALLINKEMNSVVYFLNIIKREFLNFYKDILPNLHLFKGSEQELFSNFNNYLVNLIKYH